METVGIILALGGTVGLCVLFGWRYARGFETPDAVDIWTLILGGIACTAFLVGVDSMITHKARSIEQSTETITPGPVPGDDLLYPR